MAHVLRVFGFSWGLAFFAVSGLAHDVDVTKLLPGVMKCVVTIQTHKNMTSTSQMHPSFPPGAPFEDLFRDFFPDGSRGREYRQNGVGSGFIMGEFVITNHHVVSGADQIVVIGHEEEQYSAELVGSDPKSDVALLRLSLREESKNCQSMDAKTGDLQIGQTVYAIGSPLGLQSTVTKGIVSALNRMQLGMTRDGYENFIQTDAAINQGNSGGPLVNEDMEVVGMNTAIMSHTGGSVGLGFAVPIKDVLRITEDLQTYGQVKRGWLGVQIQDIDEDLQSSMELKSKKGALVSAVMPESPAEKAGLKAGDFITHIAVDGSAQEIESSSHLRNVISSIKPNKEITATLVREGKDVALKITLGILNPGEVALLATGDMGYLYENLGFKAKEDKGAIVITALKKGTEAFTELKEGDVILSLQNQKVTTLNDLIDTLKEINKEKIYLLIERNGHQMYVALPFIKK